MSKDIYHEMIYNIFCFDSEFFMYIKLLDFKYFHLFDLFHFFDFPLREKYFYRLISK